MREQGLSEALESFPSPSHTGRHEGGEAADFVFGEVTTILHAMSSMSTERGLLRYLGAIQARSPSMPAVGTGNL